MLEKTRGIVLNSIKYSESSVIVTIYTQQFGRISYMVYGVSKKKSAFRASFLQPLTLVDLDVYHVAGKDIQRVKDVRVALPLVGIPYHVVKNSLAFFIAELLQNTIQVSEQDESLFQFLEHVVQMLDCCGDEGLANFHLVFMIRLSRFLGFAPNMQQADGVYFDLSNGIFCNQCPAHIHYLPATLTRVFLDLAQCSFQNMHEVILSRELRTDLIAGLEHYYRLHISNFRGLKSPAVLHELFD